MRVGLKAALCAGLLAVCSATCDASIITAGNIYTVLDGRTGGRIGSTVDYWGFTVNSAGTIEIDLLSWEVDSNNTQLAFDVNGDGEIAFIDTYVYLFADDGSLVSGDALFANDDDFGNGTADGSIYGYDSFLSMSLASGNYILAVGAYYLSEDEAIAQFNDETFYPTTYDDLTQTFIQTDHGDYQITWTGDVTITSDPGTGVPSVPEPASLTLLGLGGLGLMAARRKRVKA